jgi:hypothetical protein
VRWLCAKFPKLLPPQHQETINQAAFLFFSFDMRVATTLAHDRLCVWIEHSEWILDRLESDELAPQHRAALVAKLKRWVVVVAACPWSISPPC